MRPEKVTDESEREREREWGGGVAAGGREDTGGAHTKGGRALFIRGPMYPLHIHVPLHASHIHTCKYPHN